VAHGLTRWPSSPTSLTGPMTYNDTSFSPTLASSSISRHPLPPQPCVASLLRVAPLPPSSPLRPATLSVLGSLRHLGLASPARHSPQTSEGIRRQQPLLFGGIHRWSPRPPGEMRRRHLLRAGDPPPDGHPLLLRRSSPSWCHAQRRQPPLPPLQRRRPPLPPPPPAVVLWAWHGTDGPSCLGLARHEKLPSCLCCAASAARSAGTTRARQSSCRVVLVPVVPVSCCAGRAKWPSIAGLLGCLLLGRCAVRAWRAADGRLRTQLPVFVLTDKTRIHL
jgi:hypothetical protein